MGSTGCYGDELEEKRHLMILRKLKSELECPGDEITELYEEELSKIRQNDRIKDYLPLLTGRRVQEICRRNGGMCRR